MLECTFADRVAELHVLAREIQGQNRSQIRELRIELVEDGIVLHGFAYSYYGKQIAQNELLRRGDLRVIANRLEVAAKQA